jgi:hypothetical protein
MGGLREGRKTSEVAEEIAAVIYDYYRSIEEPSEFFFGNKKV